MEITYEERQRALEAGRILSSQVLREAFEGIDARLVGKWRSCSCSDERDELWRMLQCLAAVRKELFDILEYAAVKARGRDEALNKALDTAKGTAKRSSSNG